ncbi:AAEL013643-PA [Aedes aegypti]|uniref:AAEL013643-PA n=2 Tax=Aedes aegypti TaxID=7159 RepID=A0A1S4G013_AEDAE|nr:transcription factor A, mitochondrial [Aedes aegypti]EAT34084.1 AAEL013643-PA [Aedes aegypti]
MQVNNLVRLFNSSRLRISSRTSLPSYQLAAQFQTTSHLSDPAATSGSALPEKPKRPVNAYIRFLQSVRPSLLAKNPKASPTDISKLAAAQWQVLDPASKSKLEDEYKKEQTVWLQKNAKYLSQLTDQQKQDIRQARTEKTEEKAKREYKKKVKELGRPKRPLNGFLLYCADKKPKNLSKEENKLQLKLMAQKWAALSEMDKAPYNTRAAEALVKYREDIKNWEDQMIAQDHLDVIRRKNLILPPTKMDGKTKAPK